MSPRQYAMAEGFCIAYGIHSSTLHRLRNPQFDVNDILKKANPVYEARTMRRFELHRVEDKTGVSGTGVVAEGLEFSDGHACLRWKTQYRSTTIYDSMADVEAIHGHNGATQIVWVDE